MRIISKKALREYWKRHPESEQPLSAWYREVERADWSTPAQVMEQYPKASIVGPDRVIFRILNNRYRIIVRIFYPSRTVYIRFVGTHRKYDRIDAKEI